MTLQIKTVDINVNKSQAKRIIANIFKKHTRTNEVILEAYNYRVKATYSGTRKDLQHIIDNLVITKATKRD